MHNAKTEKREHMSNNLRLSQFFIQDSSVASSEEEKIAEAFVEKEEMARKHADARYGEGLFAGKGFLSGLMKKVAMAQTGNSNTGVDSINPPSAAQTPSKGGIELPSDAPGPNDTLVTTRPGGGEQHNNDLFNRKIEEKKLKAGLSDVQNSGIADLSGSVHGTSAQFSLDHNQG